MQGEASCRAVGRREANKRNRREAIVALATRSFLDNGYAGTTMSGVAAALGGSKATLWRYFPSKQALFGAVIDQATAAFRARLSEILTPSGDVAATLRCFCRSFLAKVTSTEAIALHRLVVAEAGRWPEAGRIFHEHAPALTQRLLATYLTDAIERGQLRREDPLLLARSLLGVCLSGCHQQLLLGLIERADAAMIDADVERTLNCLRAA